MLAASHSSGENKGVLPFRVRILHIAGARCMQVGQVMHAKVQHTCIGVFCTAPEDVFEVVITILILRAAFTLMIHTEIAFVPAEACDKAPFIHRCYCVPC